METLQEHLAVDNDKICTLQEAPSGQDPEDGISAKIEEILNGRRSNSKVDTWEILWQTLFPNDPRESIPDPVHVPPVELDEVYDFHAQQSCEDLRRRISDMEQMVAGPHGDIDVHVDKMVGVCERYIQDVFRGCRESKIGSLPSPTRRKRVPKPKAERGKKYPAHSDIPSFMAGQLGFESENDYAPISASASLGNSTSSLTWAASPSLPCMSPVVKTPPPGEYLGAVGVGGKAFSRANSQVVMAQPDQHLLGVSSQAQPRHYWKPSGDSAVVF